MGGGGEAAQQIHAEIDVLAARVPLAHVLDAAVVEAVLAARRGVQVEHHAQAALPGPVHRAIEHLDAALDEGVRICAIGRMVRVRRAEDPMSEWNAHGVDAGLREPREIGARHERIPMRAQSAGVEIAAYLATLASHYRSTGKFKGP